VRDSSDVGLRAEHLFYAILDPPGSFMRSEDDLQLPDPPPVALVQYLQKRHSCFCAVSFPKVQAMGVTVNELDDRHSPISIVG
jgi:hypothetical protein